jgi:hypothetical protein
MGRAESVELVGDNGGSRAVRFAVEDTPFKGDLSAIDRFATPESSATCGVPVEEGRGYVVFASRRAPGDRVAWFDTCNGTRPFDRRAGEGQLGFADTPAGDVPAALARLAGRAVVPGSTGPLMPKPGNPGADVIGLLELPRVFGPPPEAQGAPVPLAPVQAYASPARDSPVVATIKTPDDVIRREYTYEAPAAVVRERRDGWYRIALTGGRDAWVSAAEAGDFHPVTDLLPGRLAYLNEHWDGWIWPSPGAGYPMRSERKSESGRQEYPVNIIETQDIGDTLWLRIELLGRSPCEGTETPKVVHAGWVSAYTAEGKLVAWFYSRGC